MRSRFLPEIHSFRAIAILGVIATHLNNDIHFAARDSFPQLVNALAQNGSVWFVFVAGFLFQHLLDRFQYREYLASKLRNVIVPYLVISALILCGDALNTLRHGRALPPHPVLHGLRQLLTADHYPVPYWFIPMIAVIYLAAPIFAFIDRRPRLYLTVPPLLLMAMLAHRPLPVNRIGHALLYFAPVYLVGMYASHFREPVFGWIDRHLTWLVSATIALVLAEVFFLHHGGAVFAHRPFSGEGARLDLDLPTRLLMAFVVIGVLRSASARVHRSLDYLAGASFGIFFVHEFVLEAVSRAFAHSHHALPSAGTWFIALVGVIATLSLAIVWLVRRVAGPSSKYLIGC